MATIKISENNGFTFLEVIAILILVGILSAVAISRGNSIGQSELYSFAAEVKANLRYAQSNAMTTESICALVFSGNSYKFQDGTGAYELLPGQDNVTITAPSDVNVNVGSNTISYDTWGRPGRDKVDADNDGLLDDSTNDTDITISNSEGDSITLRILKETGYIEKI